MTIGTSEREPRERDESEMVVDIPVSAVHPILLKSRPTEKPARSE